MRDRIAVRVNRYGASVFEETSALARSGGAIDLGAGTSDMATPEAVVAVALEAIRAGWNRYSPVAGDPLLRDAVATHAARFYGQQVDPETEVTVTCGVTEGIQAAMLALLNPGDEVIVLEPFYDSYVPAIRFAGGIPVGVRLEAPDFCPEPDRLAAAFSPRTKALILNNPHNPSGRVFTLAELETVAELCRKFDVLAVADEVYEHVVFDGLKHIRLATLPGMKERTLTLSGAGKTFSCSGWRIGWAIGPAAIQEALNRARQFTVFCAPTPLQRAVAAGLALNDLYFTGLATEYQARRDVLMSALTSTGWNAVQPAGSFFILAPLRAGEFAGGRECCQALVRDAGVAPIPLDTFYLDPKKPWPLIRFTFCHSRDLLAEAGRRLSKCASASKVMETACR